MNIAIIGGGVMGEAIISGLIAKGHATPGSITVSDIDQNQLQRLQNEYKVYCLSDNIRAVEGKDLVVLSVKPQVFGAISDELSSSLQDEQLVLSIMAGTRIDTLKHQLKHDSIVRVMPNTPAQIGEGMSVWTATDSVSDQQKGLAQTTLSTLGKEIYVADEKYLDMATAVSGSGPAYIFLVIESMIDAGVHIGMSREMSTELVLQTVLGTARFAQASNRSVAELRNMVTSPGGTTAEALFELEKSSLRASLDQAIIAAYRKAQSLGEE
ncbi:MAG: pyrroline-5-carboxylate reductase [Chloroflexota bacterium]